MSVAALENFAIEDRFHASQFRPITADIVTTYALRQADIEKPQVPSEDKN